ncbi:MAG: ABC transporter substrate-binding protein [Verrucomicrobiaceae bacterium]|nr:ABC transporter substrate-binding protein [Verrucomicrobiaceae bacterium]
MTNIHQRQGQQPHAISRFLAGAVALLLASCSQEDVRFPPYDNTAEVEAEWKSKPELYQFKTLADLPKNLKWETGEDLPELGDPAAKKGGTFNYDMPNFPPTLRFVGPDGNNTFRREHWDHIEMSLLLRHPGVGKWMPCLAKAWAVSDDRMTVYFKLDPTASYSDGAHVTAEDYFMAFYIGLSKHVKDAFANDFFTKEYSAITKYDEHTISITLKQPKPDPILIAGGDPDGVRPMPRHFFREFGSDFPQRYQWRKMPTTGAYDIKPEDVKLGRSIALTRVKNWWARDKKYYRYRYNADRIVHRMVTNLDTSFELFRQGKIDLFSSAAQMLPPNYWHDKGDIPELLTGYVERYTFYNDYPRVPRCIYINQSQPLLDNQDIRTGISYAFDMDKVIAVVLRGDPARMQSSWSGFGRFTKPDLKAFPYDPVKAQEYFAKAGFTKRNAQGILVNTAGKPLSFTLTLGTYPAYIQAGLIWKEGALKAGLDIKIESMDFTQLFKKADEKTHDMILAGFGATPPYPEIWQFFHSENAWETKPDGTKVKKTNTNNFTMMADPELDKLIDQQRKAANEDELQRLCWQIQEIVQNKACMIPTWETPLYRYFHWRWLCWPKDGNLKITREALDAFVWWIDDDKKQETLQAMREGRSFGEVSRIFDQHREKK